MIKQQNGRKILDQVKTTVRMNGDLKNGPTKNKFALQARYKGLESNIWTELTQLFREVGGINLGQGFPDYQPAQEIVAELGQLCATGGDYLAHQYTRGYGHPRLVRALADMYTKVLGNGIRVNPTTEVLVTGGAYVSLFYAIMGNIGPGDEVIIVEPFLDCYETLVKFAGGTAVFLELKQTDNQSMCSSSWKLDSKELRAAFNERTKAILINTPNNPLGKVFSKAELQEIGNLCTEFDVMIISDEVYEWMTFDDNEHVRIASLDGMWDRTITIGSAGKTFSVTGWKLGWVYGPAPLMRNLFVAHENCARACQTPGQEIVAAALERELAMLTDPNSFFNRMKREVTQKREFWKKAVIQAGMRPIVPQGGYFMLVDWSTLKTKPDLSKISGAADDIKFVKWLVHNWKLHGIPPSAFYSAQHKDHLSNYIRFNFYKKDETLEKANEILINLQKSS